MTFPNLTINEKIRENYFLSTILIKLKNRQCEEYQNLTNLELYIIIFTTVIEDINLVITNEKNDLNEISKKIIQMVINEVVSPRKIEAFLFDKEFVIYYVYVLNTLKTIVDYNVMPKLYDNCILNVNFEQEDVYNIYNNFVGNTIVYILGINVYNFIETLKKNTVQQNDLVTITKDIERNIYSK